MKSATPVPENYIPNTPYRFFIHIIGKHKGWAALGVSAVVVAAAAGARSAGSRLTMSAAKVRQPD